MYGAKSMFLVIYNLNLVEKKEEKLIEIKFTLHLKTQM